MKKTCLKHRRNQWRSVKLSYGLALAATVSAGVYGYRREERRTGVKV